MKRGTFMSIRDEIRTENRKNFKEMPFDKKVKHFWQQSH